MGQLHDDAYREALIDYIVEQLYQIIDELNQVALLQEDMLVTTSKKWMH